MNHDHQKAFVHDLPPPESRTDTAMERLPDSVVAAALRSLPEQQRFAIYLNDVEGFRYREIAFILGVPVDVVTSGLHRSRRLLSERLERAAMAGGPTRRTRGTGARRFGFRSMIAAFESRR